ncbi:PfkB family carbohydrate kinase [Candidatus Halobeggiatoa sp. HSG11]|nr:PfkB family carbohydrate kinase [Candidatus Halobeggiatoa sp. HSG11]
MANILGIGNAALDIINIVDGYPAEDDEVRAINQRIVRGGNVANTLVVLSQLGHNCTWGGVCKNDFFGQQIINDLNSYAINTDNCKMELEGSVPTSYVTLNQRNGSRTIIHHRNLPEFSFTDFQTIELTNFDWIHFEGRNVIEIAKMFTKVKQVCPNIPISLEVEKSRPYIEGLFAQVDFLLFSKTFAQYHINDAALFLQNIRKLSAANLVCAWGVDGGYALDTTENLSYSSAYPPSQVVDTLGAGDTFNAGIIDSLCKQPKLATALTYACKLAGKKCGQFGFKGLVD